MGFKLGEWGSGTKKMKKSTKNTAIVIVTSVLLAFLISPLSKDFATATLAVVLWCVIMWCLVLA